MHDTVTMLSEFNGTAYIQALIAISCVDGVKDEEREFIENQAQMLNIDTFDLWSIPLDLSSITHLPDVTRRAIVRDCVALGAIDGEFSDRERSKVVDIANKLDVDERLVDAFERWLKDYSDLLDRGIQLLHGDLTV